MVTIILSTLAVGFSAGFLAGVLFTTGNHKDD